MNREELKKEIELHLKRDYDVYECDKNGHMILIEASKERNEAENIIKCPYHNCPAECVGTMDRFLPADEVIKLDVNEVLAIYRSILINCPKCGKQMTPLGDPPMDPYHYCWDCKIKVPFQLSETERKETK